MTTLPTRGPTLDELAAELTEAAGAHLEGNDRRIDCSADMLEHHVGKLLARVRAEALEEAARLVDYPHDAAVALDGGGTIRSYGRLAEAAARIRALK